MDTRKNSIFCERLLPIPQDIESEIDKILDEDEFDW